jgi:hypothetical protein
MKKVLKILGIIVMAAVIGFPMVSCGGDDGDGGIGSIIGGVLTLTNLKNYSGKYVVAWGNNDTIVALSVNKQNGGKVGSDGSAVLSVWNVGSDGTPSTEYKGNDNVLFWVIISDSPNVNFTDGSDGGDGGWAISLFKEGVGAGAFTDKISDINIPDTSGGILTLTNLDKYNGKYVVARADDEALAAAKNVNAQTGKGVKISGGKAILNVWKAAGSGQSYTPYKGNDTVIFSVTISETASVNLANDSNDGWALTTFQKGIGAGVFTDVLSNIDIPDTKSGKLTLTGLESFNDKYIVINGKNEDNSLLLAAAASVDEDTQTAKGVKIKNGKAVMNVWIAEIGEKITVKPYKGNDTVTFDVGIYSNETVSFNEDPEEGNKGKALATFKKGIGAGIFYISGTDEPEPPPPGSTQISIDITVPSALVGTWAGDATNGTLVFTTASISTTYTVSNKAYACIAAIKKANTSNTVTINANGTITKLIENIAYVNLYSWKIDGTTLTITDNVYGTTAFTGTKQ